MVTTLIFNIMKLWSIYKHLTQKDVTLIQIYRCIQIRCIHPNNSNLGEFLNSSKFRASSGLLSNPIQFLEPRCQANQCPPYTTPWINFLISNSHSCNLKLTTQAIKDFYNHQFTLRIMALDFRI